MVRKCCLPLFVANHTCRYTRCYRLHFLRKKADLLHRRINRKPIGIIPHQFRVLRRNNCRTLRRNNRHTLGHSHRQRTLARFHKCKYFDHLGQLDSLCLQGSWSIKSITKYFRMRTCSQNLASEEHWLRGQLSHLRHLYLPRTGMKPRRSSLPSKR